MDTYIGMVCLHVSYNQTKLTTKELGTTTINSETCIASMIYDFKTLKCKMSLSVLLKPREFPKFLISK